MFRILAKESKKLSKYWIFLGKTKVTFPEFLDLMWKMMQKSRNPEKDIHEGFRIYDTKNQGVVAIKDLRHIMTRTGEKLTQAECKSIFVTRTPAD